MLAIVDSASIFWARLMRGIWSTARAVVPRAAIREISSSCFAGHRKLMTTAPGRSRSASWIGDDRCAGRSVVLVRETGRRAGVSLDTDVETKPAQALNCFGGGGDTALASHAFTRDPDSFRGFARSCFRHRTLRSFSGFDTAVR
jgi:hypothetical protein